MCVAMNARVMSSIDEYQASSAVKHFAHKALDEDHLILTISDNGMIA